MKQLRRTAHILSNRYCIIFLLLLLCLPAFAVVQDTLTVQLKWSHKFQFAGFYTAIEKGYYKDVGLKINLLPGGADINNIEQVVSQKAQFGVESPKLLLSRSNGMPVVVLASIFQHSPEAFLTLSKYHINNIEDFDGITLGLSLDNLPATKGALVKEGMMDKVNIADTKGRIDELINGDYKVIDGYSTDLPYILAQLGFHPIVISPLSYGIDFYGDCIYTSEAYLHKNPETVKAFLSASLKGWRYAMSNKQEVAELIIEKYNPKLTVGGLMYEARRMEELILPNFVELGHTNKARWQHIGETYVKLGWLKPGYSLDGFLYSEYEELRLIKQKRLISVFSLVMTLLLGTLVAVFIFNRRLRKEVIKQTKEIRNSNVNLRKEIQHREQINQELENAKRKAEESDRLKTAFLSNMSHEIRTPMNGIIGFSELLKQHDISSDEKEKYTRIIEENAAQLLRIISDIIDISKIEVGEISIHKEPVEVKNIFEMLYHNFSLKTQQLKGDKVTLNFDVKTSTDSIIHTDAARLKQILSNLLENAIKFTAEGSIDCTLEREDNEYIFTVRDTGTGIAKDKVERVFERFFKNQDQHFADMGGTGLGLSIAKNLIELLGGTITLTSDINKGSEFRFTHPA